MMNIAFPTFNSITPDRWDVGVRLADLRATYGAQDWLTVVGAAVGTAYRLAGFTADEFAALLRAQTAERELLSIHLRRKPIMRLRKGFDGSSGCLCDENGMVRTNLYFAGGRYADKEGMVTASGPFPSSLLVTGPLNRPLGRILPNAPRCLADMRVSAARQTRWGVEFDVADDFETLARMPDEVADELGIERQRHLSHIPWIDHEGRAPAAAAPPIASPRTRSADPAVSRPRLRLVTSN